MNSNVNKKCNEKILSNITSSLISQYSDYLFTLPSQYSDSFSDTSSCSLTFGLTMKLMNPCGTNNPQSEISSLKQDDIYKLFETEKVHYDDLCTVHQNSVDLIESSRTKFYFGGDDMLGLCVRNNLTKLHTVDNAVN